LTRKEVPIALAILIACGLVIGVASARRAPTQKEREAVTAALRKAQGAHVTVTSIEVSTVDHRWASARWTQGAGGVPVALLHQNKRGWSIAWGFVTGQRADGACAFASARVVEDLYEIRCPPEVAVHGRRATPAERKELTRAFRASPLVDHTGSGDLEHICVSRSAPMYAAAAVRYPDTVSFAWFKRGPWRVVFETTTNRGSLPGHDVVLSLASCVGYNAAQYGG